MAFPGELNPANILEHPSCIKTLLAMVEGEEVHVIRVAYLATPEK